MAPVINLRMSKNDRPLATPTLSHRAIRIDHEEIETSGEHVAEVIASQGPTVLDVQHVGQVRGRRRRASYWLALGGLMLLAGAGVVAGEASQDWEGYRAEQQAATAAGLPAPEVPGHGLGGLGVGLALLGLVPFGLGLVRRGDAGLDRYTLGETPEASFPVCAQALPGDDVFGLVERSGDRFSLRFTPNMRGEVHWSGHTMELDALVAKGHTIPTALGHTFMLPDGARCRIEHEGITYRIGTVARGKTIARKNEADKPFWAYNAGSFAVLSTLLALVHLVPEEALAMSIDESSADNRFVGFFQQPDVPEEPQPLEVGDLPEETNEEAASASAPARRGPAGAMGDPRPTPSKKRMAAKSARRAPSPMSRGYDPAVASRDAGILGLIADSSGQILASPVGAYSRDSDDTELWSSLGDADIGSLAGVGGVGVAGIGRHGGGDADGTVEFGTAGLIGKQRSGDGDRYDGGANIRHGGHRAKVPRVRPGKDDITGGIDKAAIRRVVRSRINQVRYCYNKGLNRDPNMRGRVAVRFSIGPVGKVVSSVVIDNSLGDREVGTCVSNAVRRWTFPRPHSGGSAMVTYPFAFSPG